MYRKQHPSDLQGGGGYPSNHAQEGQVASLTPKSAGLGAFGAFLLGRFERLSIGPGSLLVLFAFFVVGAGGRESPLSTTKSTPSAPDCQRIRLEASAGCGRFEASRVSTPGFCWAREFLPSNGAWLVFHSKRFMGPFGGESP